MHDAFYFLFIKQVRTIEQVFAFYFRIARRAPYQYTYGICRLLYLFDRCEALLNEIIELQKIAGRIAAYCQLRKNDKVAVLLFCFFYCDKYFGGISFKIAYVVVLLCEEDLHHLKV